MPTGSEQGWVAHVSYFFQTLSEPKNETEEQQFLEKLARQ